MTIIGVELNDAAVSAVGGENILFSESGHVISSAAVGISASGGEELLFGLDAKKFSRIFPQYGHNRFWRDFSATPLSQPVGPCLSSADLVHAQLERLWAQCGSGVDGVVFAVPAGWSTDQLGLLLGIAEEENIPVRGLVDSAVAATRQEYCGGELLNLELGLHSVTISRMRQDGRVSIGDLHVVEQVGVESIERICVDLIARRFVEATRFDPLHDAASEQYLYDQLPAWLGRLSRQRSIMMTVPFQGNEFDADLELAALQVRLAAFFEPMIRQIRSLLSAGHATAVQCHGRWTDFPGVLDVLGQLPNVQVFALGPAAAAWGALRRAESLGETGEGVRLVTSLPWDRPPVNLAELAAARQSTPSADLKPTHLRFDARAYRISERPFHLGTELTDGDYGILFSEGVNGVSRRHCTIRLENHQVIVTDHSRFGTSLNGHAIDGSAILQVGDVLSLGSPPRELQLITEVDGND
jgi:hypothetical protein